MPQSTVERKHRISSPFISDLSLIPLSAVSNNCMCTFFSVVEPDEGQICTTHPRYVATGLVQVIPVNKSEHQQGLKHGEDREDTDKEDGEGDGP